MKKKRLNLSLVSGLMPLTPLSRDRSSPFFLLERVQQEVLVEDNATTRWRNSLDRKGDKRGDSGRGVRERRQRSEGDEMKQAKVKEWRRV